MQQLLRRPVGPHGKLVATVSHSTRPDGDLSPSSVEPALLATRRQHALPIPWQALHQVHSDRVITTDKASATRPFADALVTDQIGLALAVHSGDCVPVGFVSDAGVVGAAHAGWKGLEAGILESTVRELRSAKPTAPITAAVGPHIRKDRYAFGATELERLARRFGDQVVASTSTGAPALDLTAAIGSELDRLKVTVDAWSPDCTAREADQYWSHRARQEAGRIALVVWLEQASP